VRREILRQAQHDGQRDWRTSTSSRSRESSAINGMMPTFGVAGKDDAAGPIIA
jgi:hypothetical protein